MKIKCTSFLLILLSGISNTLLCMEAITATKQQVIQISANVFSQWQTVQKKFPNLSICVQENTLNVDSIRKNIKAIASIFLGRQLIQDLIEKSRRCCSQLVASDDALEIFMSSFLSFGSAEDIQVLIEYAKGQKYFEKIDNETFMLFYLNELRTHYEGYVYRNGKKIGEAELADFHPNDNQSTIMVKNAEAAVTLKYIFIEKHCRNSKIGSKFLRFIVEKLREEPISYIYTRAAAWDIPRDSSRVEQEVAHKRLSEFFRRMKFERIGESERDFLYVLGGLASQPSEEKKELTAISLILTSPTTVI